MEKICTRLTWEFKKTVFTYNVSEQNMQGVSDVPKEEMVCKLLEVEARRGIQTKNVPVHKRG